MNAVDHFGPRRHPPPPPPPGERGHSSPHCFRQISRISAHPPSGKMPSARKNMNIAVIGPTGLTGSHVVVEVLARRIR
jgi:hypothetical protein